jgi:hypothetical protein
MSESIGIVYRAIAQFQIKKAGLTSIGRGPNRGIAR